jgi:hypothetical protein
LADMHIRKKEEKAFNIAEKVTDTYRKKNDIPGTESLLEMMEAEEQQKRDRSDTASTAFSDSHVPKRARINSIPE